MTRSRLGAAALLIAAFVLGGLLGSAATTFGERRAHRDRRPSFVERLEKEIGITTNQRDSIQAVLERHQPAMDSLWAQMRPLFDQERLSIRTEINALLTPEQRAKYAAMVLRQDSLRRAGGPDRNRNGRP